MHCIIRIKICRAATMGLLLVAAFSWKNLGAQALNKSTGDIYLADPAIFNHNGTYYLYGTVGINANNGFIAYTSADMKSWKKVQGNRDGYALKKGESYGLANFWAPQVFFYRDSFFMAYAADENIAIAKSNDPAGPFKQQNIRALNAPVKQIDPFVFIDEDGRAYLYHVRLSNGNKIFVAEMDDDLNAIKPGTLTECLSAALPWENTANSKWPVAEGPSVIRHNNIYYLFYTSNDFRNPDYAVGYATANTPYGPWTKYPGNPIISKKNIGINGTGHGDFVVDGQNNLRYVFHTHFSDSVVAPRKTAIVKMKFVKNDRPGIDEMVIDAESFHFATTRDD
ncbi:MAG: glycoside hydrolase family 43 protein [Ferruginibacter sp.]